MPLLSFDTSSSGLSVAIVDGGLVLAEDNIEGGSGGKNDRQESVSLLVPTIDKLTRQLGLQKREFKAVVVGIGPGGFTGVRVAVVTGRTLAQALNLPLVGINSLETASFLGPSAAGAGVVKLASKTHCFIARYQRQPWEGELYQLQALRAPAYMPFEDFEQELRGQPTALWQAEPQLLGRFQAFADRLSPLQPVNNVAAIQAKIAHVRLSLKAAEGEDLLLNFPYRQVQPLYLRGASVTLKKGDVIERVETY